MGLTASADDRFQEKVGKFAKKVFGEDEELPEWCISNEVNDYRSLQAALKKQDVESCSLIVGIDLTGSNKVQGKNTFHGNCLHALDAPQGRNPYECALSTLSHALANMDDDGEVPAFVFGDIETTHLSVRNLSPSGETVKIDELVSAYRSEIQKGPSLSGPTSFAPLIDKAVSVVKQRGNAFHILVILADGHVSEHQNCLEKTKQAIVRASNVPLSIVMVGIGDGPWDTMKEFDDQLPERRFDNFQFLPFAEFHEQMHPGKGAVDQDVAGAAFAVCALQEVPEQFKRISKLGLLDCLEPPRKQPRTAAGGS